MPLGIEIWGQLGALRDVVAAGVTAVLGDKAGVEVIGWP